MRKLILFVMLLFAVGALAQSTVVVGGGGVPALTDNGVTVTSTEPFLAPNGTLAAPAYSFTNSTGSGFWKASSSIGMSFAGTSVMAWNASNFAINGNATPLLFVSGDPTSVAADTGLSRIAGIPNLLAVGNGVLGNSSGILLADGQAVTLTADWTCGTGGTVASCTTATIIGSGGGVAWTFTLPLLARSWTLDCDGVVGQATAATLNQWNLLTATNGVTNTMATYDMYTAATAKAGGAVTGQGATTTTFQITPSWTLGGTGTKMPFHIHARFEGVSASGTVVSVQLLAPTVGDLVTIYRGSGCYIHS